MGTQEWQNYEDVATYILNDMAEVFGLSHVEGKQSVAGKTSRTVYEIDAKGIQEDRTGFVVIECRRHTTSKINQEQAAALAYRIMDTGAKGGILVSPLGPQVGAERIMNAENIKHVELSELSTRKTFLLRFLNELFARNTEEIRLAESVNVEIDPGSDTQNSTAE